MYIAVLFVFLSICAKVNLHNKGGFINMKTLISINNDFVKETKGLHQKKNRDELGKYLIEGSRLVMDALQNGEEVQAVFIDEAKKDDQFISAVQKYDIHNKINIVNSKIMKYICDTQTPQGIAAILRKKSYALEDILKHKRLLILDRIQDPGNAGTILRAADAFGISAIILLKGTVDIYGMKAVRASMGSIFHVALLEVDDAMDFCSILKKNNFDILVTHLEGSEYLQNIQISEKAAFIVGNEGNGVSEEIASCATKLVKIPMKGKAESLNVSIAASIVMYHMMLND